MTDDELIFNWEDEPPDFPEEFKESYARLIALARIGAAVQPRPIKDLPKDDTVLLYVSAGSKNSTYKEDDRGGWREYYVSFEGEICNTGSWIRDTTIGDGHWKTTGWLPLSALPQVKP